MSMSARAFTDKFARLPAAGKRRRRRRRESPEHNDAYEYEEEFEDLFSAGDEEPGGERRVREFASDEAEAEFWRIRDPPLRNDSASGSRSNNEWPVVPANECPICWEQQTFVMRDTRAGTADVAQGKTAMVQRVDDYRRVIFDLERALRTVENDRVVWDAMLKARREYIEQHLDAHGVPHVKWTLDMLRAHYEVRDDDAADDDHTFDVERLYRKEERDLRRIQGKITKTALYVGDDAGAADPASQSEGRGKPAVNLRAVDGILRLSKRRQELIKSIEDCIKARAEDTQASSRQIITLLQVRAAPDAVEQGGDAARDVVADMYRVGGL